MGQKFSSYAGDEPEVLKVYSACWVARVMQASYPQIAKYAPLVFSLGMRAQAGGRTELSCMDLFAILKPSDVLVGSHCTRCET